MWIEQRRSEEISLLGFLCYMILNAQTHDEASMYVVYASEEAFFCPQ